MKSRMLVLLTALLLVACHKSRDVAFYQNHPAERDEKLRTCQPDVGSLSNDQDCINAWKASDVKALSYWRSHSAERSAIAKICREHKATIRSSPNCENALAAQAAVMGGGRPVYIPLRK